MTKRFLLLTLLMSALAFPIATDRAHAWEAGPTGVCSDARGRRVPCDGGGYEDPSPSERWKDQGVKNAPPPDYTAMAREEYRKGIDFINRSEWGPAADRLYQVVRYRDDWAEAHLWLGWAVENLAEEDLANLQANFHGLWKEALRHYRDALARTNDPALRERILSMLAAAEAKAGRFEAAKARDDLERQVGALWRNGNHALQKGDWAEAEQYFRRLLDLIPNDASTLHGLTIALYRQSKDAEALALIRRARDLHPADDDIRQLASRLEKAEDDRQKEARAAEEAARQDRVNAPKIARMLEDVLSEAPGNADNDPNVVDLRFLDPDEPMVVDPRKVKGQTPHQTIATIDVPPPVKSQADHLAKDLSKPGASKEAMLPPGTPDPLHDALADRMIEQSRRGKAAFPSATRAEESNRQAVCALFLSMTAPRTDDPDDVLAMQSMRIRLVMALLTRDAIKTKPREEAVAVITDLMRRDLALELQGRRDEGSAGMQRMFVRLRRWRELIEIIEPGWLTREP